MSQIELVAFTPATAAEHLGRVNIQRKLKAHVVAAYAKDMSEGRWTLDSNAICLNTAGELVNGQHRLSAVVRSGCTVTFAVMRDVEDEAILHMDSGSTRTTSDQLHILNTPNSAAAAAVARAVLMYRACPDMVWSGPVARAKATQSEQIAYIQQHGDLVQASIREVSALSKLRFNRSVMSMLYILVNDNSKQPDMWDDFIGATISGAGLAHGDPRLALRDYFIRPDLKSWGGNQSHAIVVIRAWNKFVNDVDARMFKMPRRSELPMPKVL